MDDATQERLRSEYSELLQRKAKLAAFILSEKFEDLDGVDRKDLREQLGHMNAYWNVVARRATRHLPEFTEERP